MANCPKCVIDTGGALPSAAAGLLLQSMANERADADAWPELDADKRDELKALSELDCHRAAMIRKWTEDSRLARTKIYGGEYHGNFEVNGVDGITRREK